jgi:hypothetical protein
MTTSGIATLPEAAMTRIFAAVRAFADFDADNDPWDEHGCAAIDVDGVRVVRKIDYYHRSLSGGSPDPADPDVTCRMLTIMLAEEYRCGRGWYDAPAPPAVPAGRP